MDWLNRRLANCTTTLSFDGFTSQEFRVTNGLDQGDPFSVICYIIYNADILSIVKDKTETALLFIDNAAIITTGKSFEDMHESLRSIMTREGGILDWALMHNCEFGVNKFQLLDFTKRRVPNPIATNKTMEVPRHALRFGNHRIVSSPTAKFLGIIIDNKLSWKPQIAAAIVKGQDWIIQFTRLSKLTHRLAAKYIRRLYLSVALPKMLYAADIFLAPQCRGNNPKSTGSTQAINKLSTIQRQAAGNNDHGHTKIISH